MIKQTVHRQGDILIIKHESEVPKNATPQDKDNGRTILAYGEVTGHAHAVKTEGDVSLYQIIEQGDVEEMRERFLVVEEQAQVVHEEHGAINLEPGTYKVVRQREYQPEGYRYVAD
jgi:hypothetical protein